MPNPILNKDQAAKANELLERVRAELQALAQNDPYLLFAYRRKVAKMLVYDERSGPNERRKLKKTKFVEQDGLCVACQQPLPNSYNVLDRFTAVEGYTADNTRLICNSCDQRTQRERGFR